MGEEGKKGGYIAQAWLVIFLALLYGGALAGVQTALGPLIAENKENETYDRIPELVPGADREQTKKINQEHKLFVTGSDAAEGKKEYRVYRAVAADGTTKGWVLSASGLGFADRIELLVGLDADLSKITGLYVLDQKETPNLGDKIRSNAFRDQFAGKSTDQPLTVVKTSPATGNKILAITGATISSDSVAGIVNKAIANLKGPIAELAKSQPEPATKGAEREGEHRP